MVRIKHRFIIAQLLFDPTTASTAEELTGRDILSTVKEKISQLFGDVGAGEFGAALALKFYDGWLAPAPASKSARSAPAHETHILVLRCPREAEHSVRQALSSVSQIKRATLIIRSLGISSSGRTCTDKLRMLLCRAVDAQWTWGDQEKKAARARALEMIKDGID